MPSSSSQYLSVSVPYAHGVRSLPASSPSPTSAYRSEYICKRCRARIATRDAVLSWDYRGTQGKAALVTQAYAFPGDVEETAVWVPMIADLRNSSKKPV